MIHSRINLDKGFLEIKWRVQQIHLNERTDYAPILEEFRLYSKSRLGDRNITNQLSVEAHQYYYDMAEKYIADNLPKHLGEASHEPERQTNPSK